jgi:hypothetical protein
MNVDIYDKRGFFHSSYHLCSKNLASQLKRYIVRTGREPAVSLAGEWGRCGGKYRSLHKLRTTNT